MTGRHRENRESEDLPGDIWFNVFGEKNREHTQRWVPPVCFHFFSPCNKMLHRLFLSMLMVSFLPLKAQQDTVRWLRGTTIRSQRFSSADPSMLQQKADTSAVARLTGFTLADRLDRESPLFVKSYGPGSLATVSLRGTGAAQSAVLWNGLSLNSPMPGMYDLSLLPAFLLDDIVIQSGGNGPLVGSGAMGGAIFLNSGNDFGKGFAAEALAGYGSFGQRQYGAGFRAASGKTASNTRFYAQHAANDFPFITPEGGTAVQQHAQFHQLGFTEDFRAGHDSNFLDLHFWYLENDRKIPPHMLAAISQQEQKDKSLRAVASWNVINGNLQHHISAGLNNEYIHYRDPAARLDEKSEAFTFQGNLETAYQFTEKMKGELQLAALRAQVETENYVHNMYQDQWSFGVKAVYESEKLYVHASARQGWFDDQRIPFLPAAGIRFTFLPAVSWRADAARIYRIPTLNDRYWIPGGNPELDPEDGYSASTGLQCILVSGGFRALINAGAYLSQLKKAIVWLPASNGIYTAKNIQETKSRGLEGNMETGYQQGRWKFNAGISATYSSSVITATDPGFAEGIGRQMIYTPRILYKTQANIHYRSLSLRYYHTYTGYRYTSIDHVHYLEPFDLAELIIAWSGTAGKSSITATFSIKNLYDETYQVIAWRAMPGRSYHAGLLFRFGK